MNGTPDGHPSPYIKPADWLRFVHVDPFPRQWAKLKLTEHDLQALEQCLIAGLRTGAVVPGAGGLRKVRFVTPGVQKGKSGAYRVYYVYFQEYGLIILWAVIAKSQMADLSKADRNAIAKQIQRLKTLLDRGDIQ